MFRPRKLVDSRYQLDQAWYSRADKRVGRPVEIIGVYDLDLSGDRNFAVSNWAYVTFITPKNIQKIYRGAMK